MVIFSVVALWTLIGLVAVGAYRLHVRRTQALDRFLKATESWSQLAEPAKDRETQEQARPFSSARALKRRWIWVPWVIGLAIGVTIWLVLGWPIQYILAASVVVALLLSQLEVSSSRGTLPSSSDSWPMRSISRSVR